MAETLKKEFEAEKSPLAEDAIKAAINDYRVKNGDEQNRGYGNVSIIEV